LVSDPRDRSPVKSRAAATGVVEVRAQMPGSVVKLLLRAGDRIETGQGLLVVEAMKMQNEMKSPKDGIVAKILVAEGDKVAVGDLLAVVE
jgi:biotin carboxyl carrier protein